MQKKRNIIINNNNIIQNIQKNLKIPQFIFLGFTDA